MNNLKSLRRNSDFLKVDYLFTEFYDILNTRVWPVCKRA